MGKLSKLNKMVTIQLASIPDREEMMCRTVESLKGQGDLINVMLNDYDHFPATDCAMLYFRHNEKGDAEKIFRLKEAHGYVFICDDDLIYPPNYVTSMLAHLVKMDNKAILTCHGRVMNNKPVRNSYTDRKAAYHCLKTVGESVTLDIGGSGVMCWHSDYFFPDYEKVTKKNMLDIWIAKFAKEQGCRIVLHPHQEGWIRYQHPAHTIWDDAYFNPTEQTDFYNSF